MVSPSFLKTLEEAAENIRLFHERQRHNGFVLTDRPGIVMGQRWTPIERVGICVPRSPEAFPSTILMNVIPAKIAGVSEIVLVTPPRRDGSVSPEALAAARLLVPVGVPSALSVWTLAEEPLRPGGRRPGLRYRKRTQSG